MSNRVSVLTPVGAALIGMSPAQCIHWRDPDGRTRILTVLDVRSRLGTFVGAGRILIKQLYLLHAREERAVMAVTIESRYSRSIHPLHAVLLAGTVPLFLGAALSDAEYASTYEIQWSNFASWLIVGGLIFGGIALLFAIVDLSRASSSCPGHRRLSGRTARHMGRRLFQCSDARPRRMGEHARRPGVVGHRRRARVRRRHGSALQRRASGE